MKFTKPFTNVDAPAACYAYINWRMAWEQLDRPSLLCGSRNRSAGTWPWGESLWESYRSQYRFTLPAGLSAAAVRRIDERLFADTCFEMFRQFMGHYQRIGFGNRTR